MHSYEKDANELRNKIIQGIQKTASEALAKNDCESKYFTLGLVLHTIQDSFARGHVERDPSGNVVRFQNYNDQDTHAHGEADKEEGSSEYNQAVDATLKLLEAVLCKGLSGADLEDEIRRQIEVEVLPFDPKRTPRVGGAASEFDKPPEPPLPCPIAEIPFIPKW